MKMYLSLQKVASIVDFRSRPKKTRLIQGLQVYNIYIYIYIYIYVYDPGPPDHLPHGMGGGRPPFSDSQPRALDLWGMEDESPSEMYFPIADFIHIFTGRS